MQWFILGSCAIINARHVMYDLIQAKLAPKPVFMKDSPGRFLNKSIKIESKQKASCRELSPYE